MIQSHKESKHHQIALKPLSAFMIDRAVWGGKTAGLAKIVEASLKIPDTACIACQNFTYLSEFDGLELELDTLPLAIAESLPEPGLVVRSSSTQEDGATSSGAGLYRTVFGVTSVDLLKRAIKDCWKSADIQTSKDQTSQSNLGNMGLVIQPLIPCEVSGVAFSKDPMGVTPGICIEASWGNCSVITSCNRPINATKTRQNHINLPKISTKTPHQATASC